jgi:hypothetical protein
MSKEEVRDQLRLLQQMYATMASYEARHGHPEKAAKIIRTGYEEDCRIRSMWGLSKDYYCYADGEHTALLDEEGWPQVPFTYPDSLEN